MRTMRSKRRWTWWLSSEKLNQKWKAEGRPELDIGIGINTGPMIAGNIGSDAIMSYTVIGDAVNLGSRLESLNKQYGTRIIISDATRQQLTGHYLFRPLGDVVVKGKTKAVAIFEVVGRADAAEASNRGAADQDSPFKERGSHMKQSIVTVVLLVLASPAHAQLGGLGGALKKAQQAEEMKQKIDDLTFSEEEERKLGEDVSVKIRQRFGVVQDARRSQVRDADRHGHGSAVRTARSAVDVHRARYRRRQRVRVAWRLRAYHAWGARPDCQRS